MPRGTGLDYSSRNDDRYEDDEKVSDAAQATGRAAADWKLKEQNGVSYQQIVDFRAEKDREFKDLDQVTKYQDLLEKYAGPSQEDLHGSVNLVAVQEDLKEYRHTAGVIQEKINGEDHFLGNDPTRQFEQLKALADRLEHMLISSYPDSVQHLERNLEPEENLTCANLAYNHLHSENLKRSDLSYANLYRAIVSNVDLNGTRLDHTNFREASFIDSDLSGARVFRSSFKKADLQNANLTDILMTETDLAHAKLYATKIERTNIGSCDFAHANLTGAQIESSKIDGTSFHMANLNRATLKDVTMHEINFNFASLAHAQIERVLIDNYDELNHLVAHGMDHYAEFMVGREDHEPSDFSHANLRGATIHDSEFRALKMELVDLEGAHITDTDMSKTSFALTNFKDAVLERVDLSDTDLSYANLAGASLDNVDLRRANLEGTDFTDVDLTTANLEGTDLSKTILNRTKFPTGYEHLIYK